MPNTNLNNKANHHQSVLLGTEIIMTFLRSSVSAYYWLVFLGLVVVGLVVQAGIWHRRYPVQRAWGRHQSTESESK